MKHQRLLIAIFLTGLVFGCNGGTGPTNPTTTTTTTTSIPASSFRIETLLTVYQTSVSGAFWTRGDTNSERIGKIILGVEDLDTVVGSTNLNNEGGREELQAAINRIRADFEAADYTEAFDETQQNLERYFNDADNDTWSIDGRNGRNKDWPHDFDGNDPDGWTGQIIVKVTKTQ
jgi:hypothetical protein